MPTTKPLPTVVDVLEDKAREHKQAQNTQYHVSVAQHNISEINDELGKLMSVLEDLKYYKTVLEEAFDGSLPTTLNNAVQAAQNAIDVTQNELLVEVQQTEMEDEVELGEDTTDISVELTAEIKDHRDQIRSATERIKSVNDNITTKLESKRDTWSTKIDAAKELQKILGSQNSDFARTLDHMHQLLTRDLMDSSERAPQFVRQWDNATSDWEHHQSLQSFEEFKQRHNLSESTVEDVKMLSKSQQLTLAEVSLDSLEEMKRVDELESAVELSL